MNTYSNYIGKHVGNIKITEFIGKGSMGIVFKGHHANLDIDVAVKIIRDELLGNNKKDEYLKRFEREARIAAKLNHNCITRIIDYGQLENKPYIVIDYIDGFTLYDFVDAHNENLSELNILKLVGMIASALYEAHKNNIIHRDLKPQNIIISRNGRPYITDLGLARNITDFSVTQTAMILGSPAYMAPEHFTGKSPIDLRSDIYSLGCIAYFAAYKTLPVKGESIKDIMYKHITGDIDFTLDTACSEKTINIIKKMMAADLNKRYQITSEIVDDVKQTISKLKEESRENLAIKSTDTDNNPDEKYVETIEGESIAQYESKDLLIDSNTFLKVGQVLEALEKRLGPSVSNTGDIKITHASMLDRWILWVILICLITSTIIGYFFTS